jgi:Kef-type K+ transport system membrane component KefB
MEFDSGNELLLIALGAVLILGPFTKSVCHRFGMPVSVGYIVMGLVMGAALRPFEALSTPVFNGALSTLAQLGIVALLFRVGLKSHTSTLLRKLPSASIIWVGNVVGTSAIGYAVARYGLHWSLETSLAVGTAFSATSIAVSMAVWDELGLANSDVGEMLLDVAELDDLSAAVLLAVLLGALPVLLMGESLSWLHIGTSLVIVLSKLALFMLGCYLFAHFLEARFTEFNRRKSDNSALLTISILGVGLVIAAIADYLGFSIAIGALFAGLAFSRDPEAVRSDTGFSYFYEFLTPFFFIHIGMQTDLAVLINAIDVGLVLFIAAALSKLVFTAVPAMLSMGGRDALNLGVSMIPRAEIALVVIYECRAIDDQIVPPEVFAGMVLVSLATSIVSPVALRRMLTVKRD